MKNPETGGGEGNGPWNTGASVSEGGYAAKAVALGGAGRMIAMTEGQKRTW
jgi:hypothetical protein